jgi:hypothetical protein
MVEKEEKVLTSLCTKETCNGSMRVNTLHLRKATAKVGNRKHHLALIHIIIFWEVYISNQ